jgi:adenylate cyclase
VARLALSFLGGFQVVLDGRPVTDFKSDKVRALLVYLATEADRPHRREALAGLLWPDRPDRTALSNLRYSLASLRRTIGDHTAEPRFLLITPNTIQFNPAGAFWSDVRQLETDTADQTWPTANAAARTSALALYRGGFLDGFSIRDASPFEEWALVRREQLAQRVISALGDLVAELEARGEHRAAQAFARQQVALEPWSEAAHRSLMRALALDGQRTAALHQFHACRDLLREELGVEPAEETVALYDAIRAGTLLNQGAGRLFPAPRLTRQMVASAPAFVARDDQLARLAKCLSAALAGAGRVVFVTGEAGSGKTALLAEFTRLAVQADAALVVAGGNCNATSGIGDPYLPFREIFQLLSGDIAAKRAGAALTAEHARRLWAALPDTVQALTEIGPDLIGTFVPRAVPSLRAEAFGGQPAGGTKRAGLTRPLRAPATGDGKRNPAFQQADLFEQVTNVLLALARDHPLLLTLDDLQWADAGSTSLLFHLGRRLAGSRILLVAAFRPEAIAPSGDDARHSLEPVVRELQCLSGEQPLSLDECDGRQFVEALLDSEPNRLGAGFRTQLVRHTEGQPLFTVELLRNLGEREDLVRDADGRWVAGPALHWERLPARVEALIAERIGRLAPSSQALLAAASVEGEEFTAEAIAYALDVDATTIIQHLSDHLGDRHRLVAAVSFRRLGKHTLSRYRFRHLLFRQYLYDHLDVVRRVHLHAAVGSALVQVFQEAPDELDAVASRLAWHFELAGQADRAAAYHLRAGNRAARVSAHDEAAAHFSRGQALVGKRPDTPELQRLQLELQLAAVSPLMVARGFWASERLRTLESAYEIAQNPLFDDSQERWLACATLAHVAFWRAERERTLQLSQQALSMAEHNADPRQLMLAHCLVGAAWSLNDDLHQARAHLDRALALFERRGFQPQDLLLGIHVGVSILAGRSQVLWLLGYPDQASRDIRQALAVAQRSGHATTLDLARVQAGTLNGMFARDNEATGRQMAEMQSVNIPGSTLNAWIDGLTGWVRVTHGQAEGGIQQMRQGIATADEAGGTYGRAMRFLLLAQGCRQAGQIKAGLEALDAALAWIGESGVRVYEAEAHRLRGELLLLDQAVAQEAARPAAAACFRRAVAVARQQSARWWELRAAVSLCRLLGDEPDQVNTASSREARRALAEIVAWFTEGLDTPDLRDARMLLHELEAT